MENFQVTKISVLSICLAAVAAGAMDNLSCNDQFAYSRNRVPDPLPLELAVAGASMDNLSCNDQFAYTGNRISDPLLSMDNLSCNDQFVDTGNRVADPLLLELSEAQCKADDVVGGVAASWD